MRHSSARMPAMKKILLAAAAILPLAALGGCVSPYPGIYSSGAYAGYDGGFDSGYQGYDRPITWNDYNPAVYAPLAYAPAYGPTPVSYAPPYGYYPQAPAYSAYGPQASDWYATYYCPPQMGGY